MTKSIIKPFANLRNVGIMDVKNTVSDWEAVFNPGTFGEHPLVPTAAGIVFFRWINSSFFPRDVVANEIRYFASLHEQLSVNGGRGLDAVVVFGRGMFREIEESLIIAEGVKAIDRKILVTAVAKKEGEFNAAKAEGLVDVILDGTFSSRSNASLFQALGLPVKENDYSSSFFMSDESYAVEALYNTTFPDLFSCKRPRDYPRLDPQKIANMVPELPAGKRLMIWQQSFDHH